MMNSEKISKNSIKIAVVSCIFFIICLIFRQVLLGSTYIIKLTNGGYLSGVVSQSLSSSTKNATQGINYKIISQKFFDNNLYVVVLINPLNGSSFAGFIVFKNIDSIYTPILGPGTVINVNYLVSLPKDLTQYLISTGYTYEPTY